TESLRRSQNVPSGAQRYAQFLERVPRYRWLPAFEEQMLRIETRGVRNVDYLEIVEGGKVYHWPLERPLDVGGEPWRVHHDPPLDMGGQDLPDFWYPVPERVHADFTRWWNRMKYLILRRYPPSVRQEIMSLEDWHRLELDFG